MSPKCRPASASEMQYCETIHECHSTPINANVAERLRNCLQSNTIPVRLRTLASGRRQGSKVGVLDFSIGPRLRRQDDRQHRPVRAKALIGLRLRPPLVELGLQT